MRKPVRKTIAIVVAALLMMTAIPLTLAANTGETVDISKETSRLATTVNAFSENPYSARGQWLWKDGAKFQAKQSPNTTSDGYLSTGTNISDFLTAQANARNIKFELGVAATFYGITAKVGYNLNYKHATTSEEHVYTNEFFYNYQYRQTLANQQLVGIYPGNVGLLQENLSDSASNALLNADPDELFKNYGTHVVLGCDIGGTLELNARASTTNTSLKLTENEDMKHTIPISVGSIGKIVDVKTETIIQDIQEVTKTWKSENVTFNTSTGTIGGPGFSSAQVFKENPALVEKKIEDWAKGVKEDNAGIIANGNLSVAPLWDLLPPGNTARKAQLMRAYYQKANEINDTFFQDAVYYSRTTELPTKYGTPISSAAELSQLNNSSKTYYLTGEIVLTGTQSPINGFSGTFDGQGYAIKGVNISNTNRGSVVGFFGELKGATIKGLRLEGTVKGADNVGGFAGIMDGGEIYNCINRINVTSEGTVNKGAVGGFAGTAKGGAVITNSTNYGTVNATSTIYKTDSWGEPYKQALLSEHKDAVVAAGGIVGANDGSSQNVVIRFTSNQGNVTNTAKGWRFNATKADPSHYYKSMDASRSGGIIGLTRGYLQVQDCQNTGTIKANGVAGGIVGEKISGNATNTSIFNSQIGALIVGELKGYVVGRVNEALSGSGNIYKNGDSDVNGNYAFGVDDTAFRTKKTYTDNTAQDFNSYWKIDPNTIPYLQKKVAGISIDKAASTKVYPAYGAVTLSSDKKLTDIVVKERYTDGTSATVYTGFKLIYNFDIDDPANVNKNKIVVIKDDCFDVLEVELTPVTPVALEVLEISKGLVEGEGIPADAILLRATLSNGDVIIPAANEVVYAVNGNTVTASYTQGGETKSFTFTTDFEPPAQNDSPEPAPETEPNDDGDDNPGDGSSNPSGDNPGDGSGNPSGDNTNAKKYISLFGKTTKWEDTGINWFLCIVLFGWIWMSF
ncbi:MAG: hypothetical protein LBB50_01540 [Oscillospiraceae bacterium]|jgi:hypothetical protein|nr:hypothetical protein [Oscillospiraceae bacterium]